jgi:hypothetical protein
MWNFPFYFYHLDHKLRALLYLSTGSDSRMVVGKIMDNIGGRAEIVLYWCADPGSAGLENEHSLLIASSFPLFLLIKHHTRKIWRQTHIPSAIMAIPHYSIHISQSHPVYYHRAPSVRVVDVFSSQTPEMEGLGEERAGESEGMEGGSLSVSRIITRIVTIFSDPPTL